MPHSGVCRVPKRIETTGRATSKDSIRVKNVLRLDHERKTIHRRIEMMWGMLHLLTWDVQELFRTSAGVRKVDWLEHCIILTAKAK